MNDLLMNTLVRLLQQFGLAILENPSQLRAQLAAECPECKREINVLAIALTQGVVREMLNDGSTPWPALSARLIWMLRNEAGMDEAAAQWAVQAWGAVLGKTAVGAVQVETNPPLPASSTSPASARGELLSAPPADHSAVLLLSIVLIALCGMLGGLGVCACVIFQTDFGKDLVHDLRGDRPRVAKAEPAQPVKDAAEKKPATNTTRADNVRVTPKPVEEKKAMGKKFVNGLNMELVRIEPGVFQMGSPFIEPSRNTNEHLHEVEITKPFYMAAYEVTQEDYEKVMGNNPSNFRTGQKGIVEDTRRFPVENVSWDDARSFCGKLTDMDRKAGKITDKMRYTLPSEAEWEYSCRAGTTTAFNIGANLTVQHANISNVHNRTVRVGSYAPNNWGLYDMHGNVNEWCEDWYDNEYYPVSPRKDPQGPAFAQIRVLRGGSWTYSPGSCRSALRDGISATYRGNFCGFRVVMRLDP